MKIEDASEKPLDAYDQFEADPQKFDILQRAAMEYHRSKQRNPSDYFNSEVYWGTRNKTDLGRGADGMVRWSEKEFDARFPSQLFTSNDARKAILERAREMLRAEDEKKKEGESFAFAADIKEWLKTNGKEEYSETLAMDSHGTLNFIKRIGDGMPPYVIAANSLSALTTRDDLYQFMHKVLTENPDLDVRVTTGPNMEWIKYSIKQKPEAERTAAQ